MLRPNKAKKQKKESLKIYSKNPLDMFFALGDKVTKGNPQKKADFDYYMLWIIFLAFFSILVGSLWDFFHTYKIYKLGWALVMFGILWFQYFGLKQAREMRKIAKRFKADNQQPGKEEEIIEESVDEMLKGFKNVKENKDKAHKVGHSK